MKSWVSTYRADA